MVNNTKRNLLTRTPRSDLIFEKTWWFSVTVGIDCEMDKLVKSLIDGVSFHSQDTTPGWVASNVWLGGLGKKTFANAAFQKSPMLIQLHGFLYITQCPNVNKILSNTLLQFLKSSLIIADQNWDIARVQENLYLKRLAWHRSSMYFKKKGTLS